MALDEGCFKHLPHAVRIALEPSRLPGTSHRGKNGPELRFAEALFFRLWAGVRLHPLRELFGGASLEGATLQSVGFEALRPRQLDFLKSGLQLW